jgi:two-component system sensor kinase FixL
MIKVVPSEATVSGTDPVTPPSQSSSDLAGTAEQFWLFFERSMLCYQSLDAEGRLLVVNQAWLDLLGYTREAVLGKPFADFLTPESRSRLAEQLPQSEQPGEVRGVQFDVLRGDGEVITVGFFGRSAHDAHGRFLCTHCILHDVTERKRAEQRAAHIKRVLLAIRNVNQLIVHETDRQRLIDRACANLTETLGYASAWIALLSDQGEATMTAASGFGDEFETLRRQIERGELPPCTGAAIQDPRMVTVKLPDQECRDCPLSAKLSGHAGLSRALAFGGKVYGVLTVKVPSAFVDDDEAQGLFAELVGDLAFALRKIADAEALEETQRRFRSLFEGALDGIALHEVVLDDHGQPVDYVFLETNPAFETQTGLRSADVLGRRVTEAIPGIERTPLISIYGQVALTGEPARLSLFVEPLGRHYAISAFPAGPRRFGVAFEDVTARVQAEELLRESEARFRLLLENANDAIFVREVSPEGLGRLVEVNARACEMLGYTRDELLGMAADQIVPPEHSGRLPAILQSLYENGAALFETELLSKDGRQVPAEVSARLFCFRDQALILSVTRDISQRQAAERRLAELEWELAHASRLAALGESTAGFAHEVNQPLVSIMNFARACVNLASQESADLVQIRRWAEAIGAAASQAGDIIRRLLDFARRDPPERQTVPLARLADDAMLLVGHEARANRVTLRCDRVDPALLVHVQTVAIQQVLVNLLRNGIEALANSPRKDRRVVIRAVPRGQWVEVSVADNGPGPDPSLRDRLFDPFVTTKPRGVGLGLSITKTIVEDHGGTIWTATGEEGGLAIHFTLPVGKE